MRPHDDNTPPLITKGAISRVIKHNNIPVMIQVNLNSIAMYTCAYAWHVVYSLPWALLTVVLQTTAVVGAGSSGGILVSLSTGHPIGIVVSYAKWVYMYTWYMYVAI